jgi:hypothetical protein
MTQHHDTADCRRYLSRRGHDARPKVLRAEILQPRDHAFVGGGNHDVHVQVEVKVLKRTAHQEHSTAHAQRRCDGEHDTQQRRRRD